MDKTDTTAPKKQMGRPRRHTGEKLSTTLNFRVRGGLHERLIKASAMSGRSISEEVERRVERSFEKEDRVGGPAGVRFLEFVESAVSQVQDAIHSTLEKDWNQSVYARIMLEGALIAALDYFNPTDDLPQRPGLLAERNEVLEQEYEFRQKAAEAGRSIARQLTDQDTRASLLSALAKLEGLDLNAEKKAMVQKAIAGLRETGERQTSEFSEVSKK
ncbi:MAG: hypothetical protein JWM36_4729, partial [Hyphomicrobiales bacterium]|nr:hypothetical protein [Hyphomicrobiales bacterium]